MSTESMPEQDVPSAAPYTAQEIRQVLAEGGEITHLMAEDVLAEVDSLTRQRDEAQAEARANRAAYRAACWRDQAGRCELDTAQTTIARVEALWADNAVGREGGGSYISPDELRAAIDGSALSAVTAPPEMPEDRQFKELKKRGHTVECTRVLSIGDMPLYPCDCPAGADCVHYLRFDESEGAYYCIHCGAVNPPETPEQKRLRKGIEDANEEARLIVEHPGSTNQCLPRRTDHDRRTSLC